MKILKYCIIILRFKVCKRWNDRLTSVLTSDSLNEAARRFCRIGFEGRSFWVVALGGRTEGDDSDGDFAGHRISSKFPEEVFCENDFMKGSLSNWMNYPKILSAKIAMFWNEWTNEDENVIHWKAKLNF